MFSSYYHSTRETPIFLDLVHLESIILVLYVCFLHFRNSCTATCYLNLTVTGGQLVEQTLGGIVRRNRQSGRRRPDTIIQNAAQAEDRYSYQGYALTSGRFRTSRRQGELI